MAAESGATPQHLSFLAKVAEEAKRYGVFPVLRAAEARAPGLPRIGASRLPAQNIVDLNQAPSVEFPSSTLESIEIKGPRAAVNGYWLGLTGPMGALPLHLTEFAMTERRYGHKRPFGRFLDVLAGRMLQFFYRAWADSQPAAHADRPDDDRFADYLDALSGAGENVPADPAFPRRARLHYASLFASHRSPAGIQDGLTHLLGTPVRLVEFLPRWRDIEPSDRSRLGAPGSFNGLGLDTVAGSSVRGVTDAFRVVVRARTFAEYESFLPTGDQFKIAAEALDAFTPSHLEWELEVELDEKDARPAQLDGRTRMGWTSWMAPTGQGGVRADARLGRTSRRIA
ncbi:MAG TPA: type VI secretion system baseplate subunit TssG [Caulobacteraceae bacterium]|nr:type VI secretion system baseplate subunit TssG [Caulobacteraceae bacterium]